MAALVLCIVLCFVNQQLIVNSTESIFTWRKDAFSFIAFDFLHPNN